MTVYRVRKRAVELHCIKWDGNNRAELERWTQRPEQTDGVHYEDGVLYLWVAGTQAWLPMQVGDWVFKAADGEFYPCIPEMMEQNFDVVGVEEEP